MRDRRHPDHGGQEVLQPVVDDEERARADRADREHDHRPGHHRRRFVRMRFRLPAPLPVPGHEHHPGHVERGDARADQGEDAENPAARPVLGEVTLDDGVLGEEPGERRDADDGQVRQSERHVGDRHDARQRAVPAHVHLVVHAVHHRARAQEQPGLEEAVREQERDREHVPFGPEPGAERHVADLAHGGPGQRLLDVVLGARDDAAEQQRDRAHQDHRQPGVGRDREDRVGPHEQVDPGGDHGGRVDQRRHRGGALHRVEQPGLQRHLRGLAARAEQEQQPERRGHAAPAGLHRIEHPGERHRAELGEHQEDGQGEAGVANSVDDERLLRRDRRRGLVVPEADQQVGRETHALPPDIEHEEVVAEHEQQHGREEQVHVAEEAAPVGVVAHVADRVDDDQRADPGDEQHETDRQLVDEQVHVHLQARHRDPGVQVHVLAALAGPEQGEERDHAVHERRHRHRDAEQVPPSVGTAAAHQQHHGAEQREGEQQP